MLPASRQRHLLIPRERRGCLSEIYGRAAFRRFASARFSAGRPAFFAASTMAVLAGGTECLWRYCFAPRPSTTATRTKDTVRFSSGVRTKICRRSFWARAFIPLGGGHAANGICGGYSDRRTVLRQT